MRQLHDDFIRANIDREALPQIEPGFGNECTMQFHAFGAARPRVEQFVFDFDAARQDDEFADWRRLFHVNAIIDRDAWLQMRDVDESSAQIFTKPL